MKKLEFAELSCLGANEKALKMYSGNDLYYYYMDNNETVYEKLIHGTMTRIWNNTKDFINDLNIEAEENEYFMEEE